jgi:hypothetical protein
MTCRRAGDANLAPSQASVYHQSMAKWTSEQRGATIALMGMLIALAAVHAIGDLAPLAEVGISNLFIEFPHA